MAVIALMPLFVVAVLAMGAAISVKATFSIPPVELLSDFAPQLTGFRLISLPSPKLTVFGAKKLCSMDFLDAPSA